MAVTHEVGDRTERGLRNAERWNDGIVALKIFRPSVRVRYLSVTFINNVNEMCTTYTCMRSLVERIDALIRYRNIRYSMEIRSKISKSAKAHAPPSSSSLGEIFIRIYLCSIRVAIVKYMNTLYAHEIIIKEISSWRTWAIDQTYRARHPVSSTRPTSARGERISITEVNFLMVVLKRLTLTQFPGQFQSNLEWLLSSERNVR